MDMTSRAEYAPASQTPLFSGRDVAVVERPSSSEVSLIAFQAWLPDGGAPFERRFDTDPIFRVLLDTDFHLILIYQRGNHWFETAEMADAIPSALAAIGDRRTFTYGLSMGGYAAIANAAAFGAQSFSMAAQYTIDPKLVPFETRWRHDAAVIRFEKNRIRAHSGEVSGVNFLDPLNVQDQKHTRLIEQNTNVASFYCPFGGHLVDQHLHGAFGMPYLLSEFVSGKMEKPRFQTLRRDFRRRDKSYYTNLTLQLLKRGRASAGMELLDDQLTGMRLDHRKTRLICEAVLPIDSGRAHRIFDANGHEEAVTPIDFYNKARSLRSLGRYRDFERVLEDGLVVHPENPLLLDLSDEPRRG